MVKLEPMTVRVIVYRKTEGERSPHGAYIEDVREAEIALLKGSDKFNKVARTLFIDALEALQSGRADMIQITIPGDK